MGDDAAAIAARLREFREGAAEDAMAAAAHSRDLVQAGEVTGEAAQALVQMSELLIDSTAHLAFVSQLLETVFGGEMQRLAAFLIHAVRDENDRLRLGIALFESVPQRGN